MNFIYYDLESDIKSVWIGRLLFCFGKGIYAFGIYEKDMETPIYYFNKP